MFDGYDRALDLLGIHDRDSVFGSGGRGGRGGRWGGDTSQGGPAWSNKDRFGSSSINASNQRIYDQQVADKTREAYEQDARKQITDDLQDSEGGDTGRNPLSEENKALRDKYLQARMDRYDKDTEKQKDAKDKYRPDLSSAERANLQRNREREAEAAREAAADYSREQEKSITQKDNENFTKDAEGFGTDSFITNREKKNEPTTDPEDKADTQDKSEQKKADEGSKTPDQSVQQQINELRQEFNAHEGRNDAHHAPYYA
jgi:hypothetical protein